MLGGAFGAQAAGSAAGSSLGAAVSRWLGAGDYSVASNTIVKSSLKAASSVPMMHNFGQNVVVRHREYLGEIRGSTAFTVQDSFELNPGNSRTFPWLSGIAQNFQEYSFKGVVFHYVPSSGSAISGTSPALGTVMMQTSYRSTDTAPTNKAELLNEYCSNEAVPSETMAHPIECDPKENPFNVQYVRNRPLSSGETALMYDLGVTHIATSGQLASGNVLGDLWVTYEVELKKPILSSNATSSFKALSAYTTGTITAGTLVSTIGTATIPDSSMSVLFSNNTITIAEGTTGKYVVTVTILGTLSSCSWTGPLTYTNCNSANIGPNITRTEATITGTGMSISSVSRSFGLDTVDPATSSVITIPTPSPIGGTITNVLVTITPITSIYA